MNTPNTIPRHVLRHLIDTGRMTTSHLTRKAKYRRHTCGLILIAGIDDAGIETWLWPLPTTTHGEYAARMANLFTYSTAIGQGIYYRDAITITGSPADTKPTYITHRCTDPPPPINWQLIPTPTAQPAPSDDTPPF